MSDWTGGTKANGRQVPGEYEEVLRQEELAQEQVRGRAEVLAQRLAETYTELTKLMRENPGLRREAETPDEVRQQAIYQKLHVNLQHAKLAPRCRWVKQDGTTCGSPQMKKHIYCYAHQQMMEARTLMLRLPAQEDANAIQIGLMQVQKALIEDRISAKKAGLLFYSLQLAMTNVGQTTFGKAGDEEMVTDGVDELDGLAEQMAEAMPEPVASRDMPGLKGMPVAGSRAEDLPRMNADERGLFTAEHAEEIGPLSDRNIGPAVRHETSSMAQQIEKGRVWGEFPDAVPATDADSGSLGAPSVRYALSGLLRDDKGLGGIAKAKACTGKSACATEA